MIRLRRLILALFNLIAGTLLGLLLFEAILRINSTLLFRGMALPAPVDTPLTLLTYEVRYSDADVFTWRPDLVRPLSPEEDKLEALVTYETDEYGFRNHGPLPPKVDAVVLGRSISLAGHLGRPWPELLAENLDWSVLNLAQPGSGIESKRTILLRYGLARRPRWVIVEVLPSIDIVGSDTPTPLVSQELLIPTIQGLVRRWQGNRPVSTENAIYPLTVDLPGRQAGLTCCLHYLEFFSLDKQTLEKSQDWQNYRQKLLKIVVDARKKHACVALLYVPTKPDLYFPLALHPEQLQPTLREVVPLQIGASGWLEPDPDGGLTEDIIRRNVLVGHDMVQDFARQNGLLWIDPNDVMHDAAVAGQDPFMVFDSHWNQFGHQIVAQVASELLDEAFCP